MVSRTTPLGYTTQWEYADPASTFGFTVPNARINATGHRVSYAYDEWGRLRTKTYPNGTAVQYHYDGRSRLVRMVDATGETLWQYTPQGWLQSEQKGNGWQVEYAYHPNGLLASLSERLSGQVVRTIEYAYNQRNLLSSLSELGKTSTWTYDADGRVVAVDLGNGARREYSYQAGRLHRIVHKDSAGNVLASFTYSYQQNGRCKQVEEQLWGTQSTVRYGYDFLNRLVREVRTGYAPTDLQWSYDAVGNRLQQVKDGVVTNYSYDDDNRLLTAGSVTYEWDANGNMTKRIQDGVTTHFQYDFDDRLVQIYWSNVNRRQVTHRYRYDGLGRRVERSVYDGGWRRATYRFAGDVLIREQWQNPSSSNHLMMDWKYTWADGLVNAVNIVWGDQWWAGSDRLGSARVHTDELGEQVTYLAYFTAFGERYAAGFRTPYTFAGDWRYRDDGDAGLLHVGARYYEPATGRWTTADKYPGNLYQPLSLNRYLYCEDDPVNAVDPSGDVPLLLAVAIGVGVGIVLEGVKDYLDDGQINDPWWHYAVGGAVGGLAGVQLEHAQQASP